MIRFICGIPGAGKTYHSVYDIYKYFIEPQKQEKQKSKKSLFSFLKKQDEKQSDKYEICYTNINGFNFNLSEKIKPLDLKDFKAKIEVLHSMYKFQNANDDELIEKAKEFNLYKSFIVIDECHNFFEKKSNEVLVWLLTYHRHLYIDFDLITQNFSLVSSDYVVVSEVFIKAIDPIKRISKNTFRYTQFCTHQCYLNSIVKRYSIKAQKEVFDLYVSGDDTRKNSIFRKFFGLILLLIIVIIFAFNFFINFFSNDDKTIENSQNKLKKETNYHKDTDKKHLEKENKPINFYFDVVCYDNSYCKINNNDYKQISYQSFMYLKDKETPLFLTITQRQKSITTFSLIYDKDVFYFLRKGLNNEKSKKNTNFTKSSF